VGVVPIVPAAVIFDLAPLGRPDRRPTPAMAYAAADAASPRGIAEGSVGVGAGATVGKALGPAWAMKGGVGIALSALGSRLSATAPAEAESREPRAESPPLSVAALAVVNAFGDVRDAAGRIVAGARDEAGGFADATAVIRAGTLAARFTAAPGPRNTTLALVALDRPLSRVALRAIASAAAAALHRRITPAGTSFDGDVVFATSPLDAAGAAPVVLAPAELLAAEVLAAAALEAAVERAVRTARGRDGVPGLADHQPPGH
jgi:L-aminopeptidase/D-esterase-like protein